MLLQMWWLYVVGAAVLAFVIFQAWDQRRSLARFTRQEQGRVDQERARHAEGDEYARQIGSGRVPTARP